jgi:hypothetical protein
MDAGAVPDQTAQPPASSQQAASAAAATAGVASWKDAAILFEQYARTYMLDPTSWASKLHVDSPQRSALLQQFRAIAALDPEPLSEPHYCRGAVAYNAAAVLEAAVWQPLWHNQLYTEALACIASACVPAFAVIRDCATADQRDSDRLPLIWAVNRTLLLPCLQQALLSLSSHLRAAIEGKWAVSAAAAAAAAAAAGSSNSSSSRGAAAAESAPAVVSWRVLAMSPVVKALADVVFMLLHLMAMPGTVRMICS